MADFNDVIAIDQHLEEVLNELESLDLVDKEIFLSTKALCLAIQGHGIRLHAVANDMELRRSL